jgi:hypothetical protein
LVCGFVSFAEDPAVDRIYPPEVAEQVVKVRRDPVAARAAIAQDLAQSAAKWGADPEGFLRQLFELEADSIPEFWKAVTASTYGGGADPDDRLLLHQPMGFDVRDIQAPIHGWYGDQDPLLAMAQELKRRVPSMDLTLYPGEGHLIEDRHAIEWLSALARS